MAMLICGSSLAELGRGIGVARVAYMRLLAMVTVFGHAAGGGGGGVVSLAGSAASSGALTSFFCLCLGFLGGVGPTVTDLFFPLGGVLGAGISLGVAAASA